MTRRANLFRCFTWLCWGVIVVLWGAAALVKWVGPQWLITSPLAFVPKLLPGLAFLVPMAMGLLTNRRRMMGVAIFSIVLWFGPALEWRLPGRQKTAEGPVLRIMTCNRGQNHGHSVKPWIDRVRPDVIAFQDAWSPDAYLAGSPDYADYPHRKRVGEHVLLSRYPITFATQASRGPILRKGSQWHYQPAGRFGIDFHGREIIVWSVHLRSPRNHFRQLRGALAWTVGWSRKDGIPASGATGDLENYWAEHRRSIEALNELFRSEQSPTVIAGDWNVPDVGPDYQAMTVSLTDAHREVGRGYGSTFPGDLKWWPAFHQPWLRIDYVLSDCHWRPVRCVVEPDSEGAQHFAVFAELELRR